MGMKLIQRDARADTDKQLADVWRNLESIVKEMDAMANRIKTLESNGLPDGLLMIEDV